MREKRICDSVKGKPVLSASGESEGEHLHTVILKKVNLIQRESQLGFRDAVSGKVADGFRRRQSKRT